MFSLSFFTFDALFTFALTIFSGVLFSRSECISQYSRFPCVCFVDLYSMAEEFITNVGQEEHVAYDNNCNLRKIDINVEEDSDVSLREILDTAFTSSVDEQDNVAFERCK